MGFSRASVAYKQDGTQVTSGTPRYETALYAQGVVVEEGTTNLFTSAESQTLSASTTKSLTADTYTLSMRSGTGSINVIQESADLCAGGTAYSHSDYSGFPASQACDNDTTTAWSSGEQVSAVNVWWAYKVATAKTIQRVKIIGRSGFPELNFKNFKIQGSNDSTNGSDGTWTDLATGLNTSSTIQWDTFDFGNSTAYTWIRIYGAAQSYSGAYYLQFAEVEMMESQVICTTNITTPQTFTLSGTTNIIFAPTGTVQRCQLEAKDYATSWQIGGTARVAETLTIPTAGAFAKSSWTYEKIFIPVDNPVVSGRSGILWQCKIDANNYYELGYTENGYLYLTVKSGGTAYTITDNAALAAATQYTTMAAGDGSHIRLCKNGSQIGSDTSYVEPVGTLPTNMFEGSDSSGANQQNGISDDLRITNRGRTLTEHQTYYNGTSPLPVDDATTAKMAFDNTLAVNYGEVGREVVINAVTGRSDSYIANENERITQITGIIGENDTYYIKPPVPRIYLKGQFQNTIFLKGRFEDRVILPGLFRDQINLKGTFQ